MTVSIRRKKEKEALRLHILEVAKEIAAADGWQNVTIRKICDKIGYSAPVIYQHFENKEDLLQSLRVVGFTQIFEQFEKVDVKHSTPEKRLLEYALVWWKFSKQNPELYQVMFNLQGAICENNENKQSRMFVNYYSTSFKQMSSKAHRSEKYKLELCDNFISVIHGFISMRMVNKIKYGSENAEQVFKNSILRFIHSITD